MSYKQNPRYLVEPSGGGADQVPSREEQVISYAASVALVTQTEKTKVLFGLITGALALSIGVTNVFDSDELVLKLPADATGRTVTFGAGFTASSSTIVLGSNQVGIVTFIFDGATSTWVERSRNIFVVSTVGGNNTFTGNNTFSGKSTFSGQAFHSVPSVTDIAAPAAINATATATAAQMAAGVITSTSAAATAITTPTATALATQLGVGAGSTYDLVIDNSGGANIVTLTLDASIVALAVVTGGNTLTVASGTVGLFRIYFTSASAATISRIG